MKIKQTRIKQDKEKILLFSRLSQEGRRLIVFYDESPSEYPELDGRAEELGPRRYAVNPPYSFEVLEHWLSCGGWQAVIPDSEQYQPFNTFKKRLREVEAVMRASGVEILIDSFHDDTEWNVFQLA